MNNFIQISITKFLTKGVEPCENKVVLNKRVYINGKNLCKYTEVIAVRLPLKENREEGGISVI